MEVFTTERPTPWSERIRSMDKDQKIHADVKSKTAVRAAIWNVCNISGKKFTTRTIYDSSEKKNRVLEITRIK